MTPVRSPLPDTGSAFPSTRRRFLQVSGIGLGAAALGLGASACGTAPALQHVSVRTLTADPRVAPGRGAQQLRSFERSSAA